MREMRDVRNEDRDDAELGELLGARPLATPPVSAVFLGAVKKRRVARRVRAAGAVLGAAALLGAGWAFVSQRGAVDGHRGSGEIARQPAPAPDMPTLARLRSQDAAEIRAVAWGPANGTSRGDAIRAGDSADPRVMDAVMQGL